MDLERRTMLGVLGVAGAAQIASDSIGASRGASTQASRLDIVSVKNFGAIGDGTADDWAAVDRGLAELSKLPEGGTLFFPAGRYRLGRQVAIPDKCILSGAGCPATMLVASDDFRGPSLIANAVTNGKQEWCCIERMYIDGNKGGGARCSVAVVNIESIFINSYLRDVVIADGSATGLRVAANAACGPVLFDNIWLARHDGDGLLVENRGVGAVNGLVFVNLTSENHGAGRAAIRLRDHTGNGGALGWHFINTHIEMGQPRPGSRAIVIDGVNTVLFDGVQLLCGNPAGIIGIEITERPENANIQLRGITNANLFDPSILDRKHNVRCGAMHIPWYSTPDVGIYPSRSYVAAFADTVTPDMMRGNHLTINASDNRPLTIAEPINAMDEMTLSMEIVNVSSGAMGPLNWRLAGVAGTWWRNPSPGKTRTVQFRRRRGKWIMIGAPSPEF